MSLKTSDTAKIDRLSSLPPELLSVIFDLAHDPGQPLIQPLSRNLLPYHRENLYRQIRISSSYSLSKLLAAVETSPSLALLVHDLRIARTSDMAHVEFESVARQFTFLKSLDYGRARLSKVNIVAPLQSLSYAPEVLDANEIEALARLPLIRLELKLYISQIEIPDDFQPSTTMETLEELALVQAYSNRDDDQWDPSVSRFVKRCPKLRSLKLVDDTFPEIGEILQDLVGGCPHLIKLEFDTPTLPDLTICRFTHLYPLFPNLTYLGLGEGTTSPDLASHLRQLSFLTTLRLGPGAHFGFMSAENVFSLVQAPTRPPALELLIVECFEARIGYRCGIQDMILPGSSMDHQFKVSWEFPKFCRGVFDEEDCRQLLELARSDDVRIEGDIHTAVKLKNSRNLEFANRHILYAQQNQTLDLLKSMRNSRRGVRLRDLDLDLDLGQHDLRNLKLVKIDLPEEDWYQFTLE